MWIYIYIHIYIHTGKWHLGGMREEMRVRRTLDDDCSRPSPNQHGFEEYISGIGCIYVYICKYPFIYVH
jgi:hypothetical protein